MLVGAGIQRVVFAGPMPEGWALDVLSAAGVKLHPMPEFDEPGTEKLRVQ
jgi:hypothetical protein